jgi:hypothetical protein
VILPALNGELVRLPDGLLGFGGEVTKWLHGYRILH